MYWDVLYWSAMERVGSGRVGAECNRVSHFCFVSLPILPTKVVGLGSVAEGHVVRCGAVRRRVAQCDVDRKVGTESLL
jgi:hypothetical protein